jgi:hypothetical protein
MMASATIDTMEICSPSGGEWEGRHHVRGARVERSGVAWAPTAIVEQNLTDVASPSSVPVMVTDFDSSIRCHARHRGRLEERPQRPVLAGADSRAGARNHPKVIGGVGFETFDRRSDGDGAFPDPGSDERLRVVCGRIASKQAGAFQRPPAGRTTPATTSPRYCSREGDGVYPGLCPPIASRSKFGRSRRTPWARSLLLPAGSR